MKKLRSSRRLFTRLFCCSFCGFFLWGSINFKSMGAETNNPPHSLEAVYQEAHQRFLAQSNNAEAAWQFSRACFDRADAAEDNSSKAGFAMQGINAGRQSVLDDNNSAPAHYYLGMNIGQLADTRHNLSGLHLVKEMEKEFLAAHALDEHFDYAGPDRNLGLLYEETPVFLSIGSRSKARQHLERAVELAPDFPENRLNLIEAYLKWDYHTEAMRELENLEKIWPKAQKEFTGDHWAATWTDWNKRLDTIRRKLEVPRPGGSPHSTQ